MAFRSWRAASWERVCAAAAALVGEERGDEGREDEGREDEGREDEGMDDSAGIIGCICMLACLLMGLRIALMIK